MSDHAAGAGRPITEEELHAYVDGQLAFDRLPAVERYLQDHADVALRVNAYIAQRAALREALASPASEPIPPQLDLQLLVQQRLGERRGMWRIAAAVLLAFGLGGGGGWLLHGRLAEAPPSTLSLLAREAIANHMVYAADRRRPTELGAEQRDDLARWVSNRLNHRVAPPDLTDMGFRYLGGRLAATPQGAAGLFMYQNAHGTRLTVFVLPMTSAANRSLESVDVGAMDSYAWIDKGVGYTVVAPVPQAELHHLADQVRRQLEAAA